VHHLRFRAATSKLREFVRAYAQRDLHIGDLVLTESCPARLEQDLEFQFLTPFRVVRSDGITLMTPRIALVGAHTHGGAEISLSQSVQTFAVFFQPAGFSRLFGIPVREMSNCVYAGDSVSGRCLTRLWHQLAEAGTFERRVQITEGMLLKFAERRRSLREIDFGSVADYILARRGVLQISTLAHEFGLGLRQFERRFVTEIGVTPKRFARVARFQTALDMKISAPHRSWLEIAHDLEYHDQMHMVHDFHDLAGDTPGKTFSTVGDVRPVAFAERESREDPVPLDMALEKSTARRPS
jgi:AraC-like DNA-binding protein